MVAPKLRFKEFDHKWDQLVFSDVFSFYNTNSYSRALLDDKGEIMNIHYGDIHTKFSMLFDVRKEQIPYLGEEIDKKKIREENFLKIGDLVIADASEDYKDIGKAIEVINLDNKKVVAGLHTYIARPTKPCAIGFNGYLMQTANIRSQIQKLATGISVLGISKTNISKIQLCLPSEAEQDKIASFLSAVDEKIAQLSQKHQLLSQYKQGMMQKLFSQQIRFKADDGSEFSEWKTLKFKYFIQERNQICSDATVELCSLTIEKGVTEKTERYTRDFLVKDEKNAYKEVHFNDFVMNPMNLRFGAIAKSNMDKIVKISKYYNVFNINQNIVNLDYFVYFSVSKPIIDFYNLMSTGSLIEKRRNHFKDFIQYEKSFPCLEEQTKIANFLSAIDQKIEVTAQQIEQAKQWKKGLLQQMFV
jgi:type I restriction enzyme S subunit